MLGEVLISGRKSLAIRGSAAILSQCGAMWDTKMMMMMMMMMMLLLLLMMMMIMIRMTD